MNSEPFIVKKDNSILRFSRIASARLLESDENISLVAVWHVLKNMSQILRDDIKKLDFTNNKIEGSDLGTLYEILKFFPNVTDLDLSGTLIRLNGAVPMKRITCLPSIKRVYIYNTALATMAGKFMFNGLDSHDIGKLIFLKNLDSDMWGYFVVGEKNQLAVLDAHMINSKTVKYKVE